MWQHNWDKQSIYHNKFKDIEREIKYNRLKINKI